MDQFRDATKNKRKRVKAAALFRAFCIARIGEEIGRRNKAATTVQYLELALFAIEAAQLKERPSA